MLRKIILTFYIKKVCLIPNVFFMAFSSQGFFPSSLGKQNAKH